MSDKKHYSDQLVEVFENANCETRVDYVIGGVADEQETVTATVDGHIMKFDFVNGKLTGVRIKS